MQTEVTYSARPPRADEQGMSALHLTLAIPHFRGTRLADARTQMAALVDSTLRSVQFRRIASLAGFAGAIQWPHVRWAYSEGWHYHVHLVALFESADVEAVSAAQNAFERAFRASAARRSIRTGPSTVVGSIVHDWPGLASYLAMGWKPALPSSTRSLHIFDLAERAAMGRTIERGLVLEYAVAMRGRHTATIPPRLRQRLGL